MARNSARVSMPAKAQKGEVIEIKTLIQHRMETGYRVDATGKNIPRDIVHRMRVFHAGKEIFAMDFTQGVAANPYVALALRAEQSGEFLFVWEDHDKTLAACGRCGQTPQGSAQSHGLALCASGGQAKHLAAPSDHHPILRGQYKDAHVIRVVSVVEDGLCLAVDQILDRFRW